MTLDRGTAPLQFDEEDVGEAHSQLPEVKQPAISADIQPFRWDSLWENVQFDTSEESWLGYSRKLTYSSKHHVTRCGDVW